MASSPSQRDYSAPCPGCGAPVHFANAQAAFAVCAFCRSTVARRGEVLERVGSMAEVFEDYSPLQIGATGQAPDRRGVSIPFTVVGRLQLRSDAGAWNEWVLDFSDGQLGWLSEDNGSWVLSRPWQPPGFQPKGFVARDWKLGRAVMAGGDEFTVSSVQNAQVAAAQGQLTELPPIGRSFKLVELRDPQERVWSVDFGSKPPGSSLGMPVQLDALQMQGLREGPALQREQGQHFNCPHCAAALELRFGGSKTLSCPSCGSLVDLSAGLGQALQYAEQRRRIKPQIPLGSEGQLDGLVWQVVGFQRRTGHEQDEDGNESFSWDEYLLYQRKAGFAFLVDSEDGWSMARVVSGVPKLSKTGGTATYLRKQYVRESTYQASTDYAEGEFYWPVRQGQTTDNVDYVNHGKRSSLAQETEQGETTWTHGQQVSAETLAQAFGVGKLKDRSQAGPLSGSKFSLGTILFWLFLLLFLLPFLRACISSPSCDPRTDPNCTYSRSSSGSYGGYTSGGSHK
ncbi:DUF4178 domain-containing protein [Comamonas sp. GB3 AK4-5]|uniref:DUF4178 domain-containing protein n=1 Tax=Comamonas sp. GB3 AK4-5 TaxID=3231487 RepID=UPI00351DEBB2